MTSAPNARKWPLPLPWMGGLLGIKVGVALVYAWVFFHLSPHTSDTWGYFDQSRQEAALIHSPGDFWHYSFPHIQHWSELLHYAFWNNLKENVFVLILLGLNFLTGANPYLDSVLFALLTFPGWVAFLRLLKALYPGLRPWLYIIPFLLPTFLFCYSGMHSDGLVFAVLGFICYDMYRRAWWRFALGCLILLALKEYMLVFLLPICLGNWMTYGLRIRVRYAWMAMVAAGVTLLLASIPEQAAHLLDFLHRPTKSPYIMTPLTGSVPDYIAHLPRVAVNVFLRPWAPARYLLSGVEIWALVALWVWSRFHRPPGTPCPFFGNSLLFYTLIIWLLIGYTCPSLGALIRYRALFFPFIIAYTLLPGITKK